MVYDPKSTKYVGKHRHTRGTSLAEEADMVLGNVLKSSGFFSGPGSGLNHGFGTTNPSMENFTSKWNDMNRRQRKGPMPYAKGSKIHKFRGI